MSARRSRVASAALWAAAIGLLGGGVPALRRSLNRRFDSTRRVLDDASILRPAVSRVISLGHTEWVTDMLWINATLYYGESLFAHLPARYIERYVDAMIELDPSFKPAYMWGATSLIYRTVASTRGDARRARSLLQRGLARFPMDPELHLQLGYLIAFEETAYVPRGSAAARALRAESADHLRFAASAGVGPPWLALTASSILVEAGRERDAVMVLGDALTHTVDPAMFSSIEARLAELLRNRASADPLSLAFLESARSRRQHHPWMPPTLHTFVGEPVLPR